MALHAVEVYERGVQSLWDGDVEAAIADLDRAAAQAPSEELAEQILIRKAEALIAAGRDGAEIAALPEIVLRRRSPRHVYFAALMLMRHLMDGDPMRALFYGGLAGRAAKELDDPFALATVLNERGVILVVRSQPTAAIELLESALAIIDGAGVHDERLTALRQAIVGNLGGAKVLANQFRDGVRLLESVRLGRSIGHDGAELQIDLAAGYLGLEEYDAARAAALRALQFASCPRHVRNANHLLGEIYARLGRHEESEAHFDVVAGFYPEFRNVKQMLAAIDLCSVVNWNV